MHSSKSLVGFQEPPSGEILVKHTGEFFSCCTYRLECIRLYLNQNARLPKGVKSEFLFSWYKPLTQLQKDITFDYFADYNKHFINLETKTTQQAINQTIIKKYFSPSLGIKLIISRLKYKYNLDHLSGNKSICALVYYKANRLRINYNELLEQAKKVQTTNKDVVFIIQSDTSEFLQVANKTFPGNIIFKDEIRFISENLKQSIETIDREHNYIYSKYLLATFYIISSCKILICDTPIDHKLWIELLSLTTKD